VDRNRRNVRRGDWLLGVVVGAVVTGFVTLRQARLATQREHDVRKIEWEQARKAVRDAFQRESLLAVQDAVEDARRATVREWDRLLSSLMSGAPSEAPDIGDRSSWPAAKGHIADRPRRR
jgi:hypothetical protein